MRVAPVLLLALAVTACASPRGGAARPASGPLPSGGSPASVVAGELGRRLDAFLAGQARDPRFSGAFYVAKNGEVVLDKGYGPAHVAGGVALTTSTLVDVGSLVKPFTAAAVLRLEEMGKLSVHDSLARFFGGVPAGKRGITLHHLLTHSAGFPEALGFDYDLISRDSLVARALGTELRFGPGSGYGYSNVGYSLLAAIVEKVSGQPYERFVRENVLLPAGLHHTGYRLLERGGLPVAHGYRENGQDWGSPLEKPWLEDGPSWYLRGNGGMLSTGRELARWMHAWEAGRVLADSSRRKAWARHVDEGMGGRSFYGYGWTNSRMPNGQWVVWHNGGNPFFHADMRTVPEAGLVLVAVSNQAGGPFEKVWEQVRRMAILGDTALAATPSGTPPPPGGPAQAGGGGRPPSAAVVDALMEAVASGAEPAVRRFVEEHMSPGLRGMAPLEEHVAQFQRMHRALGRAEVVDLRREPSGERRVLLRSGVDGRSYVLWLSLTQDSPPRVEMIRWEQEKGGG